MFNNLISSSNNHSKDSVNIPGLLYELKPYQKDAVDWMIQRESILKDDDLHPMFDQMITKFKKVFYFQCNQGLMKTEKQ